jgi:CRISPR/Cas system-associated protein Cas5 (RAMP superfamily)
MMKCLGEATLKPVNPTRPHKNFDFRAAFMEQSARFERTLPTAYHKHLLSSKLSKVTMFGCVGR